MSRFRAIRVTQAHLFSLLSAGKPERMGIFGEYLDLQQSGFNVTVGRGPVMRFKLGHVGWLKGYIIAGFVLCSILGWYYLLYVPSRREHIMNRNLRVVADMSDQIQAELLALAGPFTNTALLLLAKEPKPTNASTKAAPPANRRVRHLELSFVTRDKSTDADEFTFQISQNTEPPALELCFFPGKDTNGLRGLGNLAEVIGSTTSTTDFNEVLIVDANDVVIYQRPGSTLRFEKFKLSGDAREHTTASSFAFTNQVSYRVCSQPLRLVAPASSSPPLNWTVCGLVRSTQLQVQVLAFHYVWMVAIGGAFLLLLFTWPFMNIMLLGQLPSVRPGQTMLLYFAALANCALLTLLCSLWVYYATLNKRLDTQLPQMAGRLLRSFDQELNSIHTQLTRIAELHYADAVKERTNILADTNWADKYRYFKMVTWIDPKGTQDAKWTIEPENTRFISVSKRAYFQAITGDQAWSKTFGNRRDRFFLEPIYSWNTGENQAVFSMWDPQAIGRQVITMEGKFLSLFGAVFPADVGYCIVDSQGLVLFHSDERRNLRENFVTECNSDPVLVSLLRSRVAGSPFSASYLNALHTLYVTPVRDLPWSLVVFRHAQTVESILVQTVSSSIILSLLGLAVLCVPIALSLVIDRRRPFWFWPRAYSERRYGWLAVGLVLAALALPWLGLRLFGDLGLLTVLVSLPALAFAASWLTLRSDPAEACRPAKFSGAFWLALSALIFVSSVIPALSIFTLILRGEMGIMIKRAQMHLARDMEARENKMWVRYHDIRGGDKLFRRWLDIKGTAGYFSDFFGTWYSLTNAACLEISDASGRMPEPGTELRQPSLIYALRNLHLLFDEVSKENRDYLGYRAGDGAWHWAEDAASSSLRLCVARKGHREPSEKRVAAVISTQVPTILPQNAGSYLLLVLVGLGMPCLFAWRMDRDLFGHGVERSFAKTPAFSLRKSFGWRLVLGTGDGGVVRPSATVSWEQPPASLPTGALVQNLQIGGEDFQSNLRKVQLLERLIAAFPDDLLVFSNVHPLNFKLDPPAQAEPGAPSLRLRWLRVLRHLNVCYAQSMLEKMRQADLSQEDCRSIWAVCSPVERQLLHEAALGQVIQPTRPETASLAARGLVRLEPIPQIANKTFQHWVRTHFYPDEAVVEVPESDVSTWRKIRGPIVAVALVAGLVFFFTQKSLWDRTIALVPAFAAAITGLITAWKTLVDVKNSAKR